MSDRAPIKAFALQQTAIGILINVAMSFLFFVLTFGLEKPVDVWTGKSFAIDFLPQAAAVSFFSYLPPALIARAKRIQPFSNRTGWRTLVRALIVAVAGGVLFSALAAGALYLTRSPILENKTALMIKFAFAAAVTVAITQWMFRGATLAATARE